jgi:hypothetical protein
MRGEIDTVINCYPTLQLVENNSDLSLIGTLNFSASFTGKEAITANYDLIISLPSSYPDDLPKVYSSGYKLDSRFEHINPDGSFCLAVPLEERKLYESQPSLLGFINNLVVPFLYGYSYFLKHGEHPFGERAHGNRGILDFYQELFDCNNIRQLIFSLYSFSLSGYKPHDRCPCGSGKKVLKCHKAQLKALLQQRELLQADLAKFIET